MRGAAATSPTTGLPAQATSGRVARSHVTLPVCGQPQRRLTGESLADTIGVSFLLPPPKWNLEAVGRKATLLERW
jgi:hypothetical protein